jgi:hypothetical protein
MQRQKRPRLHILQNRHKESLCESLKMKTDVFHALDVKGQKFPLEIDDFNWAISFRSIFLRSIKMGFKDPDLRQLCLLSLLACTK